MVNKNYLLVAGVCSVLALQPAFAQEQNSGRDMTYRGVSYDALDTAYIPNSRMEQQMQYLNYEYAFPAKPRNMWEIGVNVGTANIFGDVPSKSLWNAAQPLSTVGFGVSVRKALGYATSIRLQYNYLGASGYEYRSRKASNEAPWNATNSAYAPNSKIYSNYKFVGHEATLQLVGAINNIKFHKAKNSASLYAFAGGGAMIWKSMVSTQNKDGKAYNFSDLDAITSNKDRNKEYKSWLKDADYNYLVNRENYTGARNGTYLGDYTLSPVIVGGVGVQFKLGNRVSLQIEDKISWTGLDNLDGVAQDPKGMAISADKDIINYASIGLGFNIGNKNRSVLPLWWVNPMDHIYSELSNPRHMPQPEAVITDSDGDGVADALDKCPGTPAGVPVDTKGCPLDTDGDGVPDYLDKQLITPTECQPVDADGVGKCPEPECCKNRVVSDCNISANTVCFKPNSATLSGEAQKTLAILVSQMKANPTCKVVVMGNAGNNKLQQQRSWDRVNAVISYLSETHMIDRNRFIFQYKGGTGDLNCVMYRTAMPGEEGPSNIAPPHPQLGTK